MHWNKVIWHLIPQGYRIVGWDHWRPLTNGMAYEYDTQAWEDWDGEIHFQVPTDVDPSDAAGLLVHYFDVDTGDELWRWVYIDGPLDDWDDWDDLIAIQMDMYGIPMA